MKFELSIKEDGTPSIFIEGINLSPESIDKVLNNIPPALIEAMNGNKNMRGVQSNNSSSSNNEEKETFFEEENILKPPILFSRVSSKKQEIQKIWEKYGSIYIKNGPNKYKILFPKENTNFPTIKDKNDVSIYENHSYPICSCPSYRFNPTGKCKHIEVVMETLFGSENIKNIDWLKRNSDVLQILKNTGISEFQ